MICWVSPTKQPALILGSQELNKYRVFFLEQNGVKSFLTNIETWSIMNEL
jgi:hypothetical protein